MKFLKIMFVLLGVQSLSPVFSMFCRPVVLGIVQKSWRPQEMLLRSMSDDRSLQAVLNARDLMSRVDGSISNCSAFKKRAIIKALKIEQKRLTEAERLLDEAVMLATTESRKNECAGYQYLGKQLRSRLLQLEDVLGKKESVQKEEVVTKYEWLSPLYSRLRKVSSVELNEIRDLGKTKDH
jgi:hypothetical protein